MIACPMVYVKILGVDISTEMLEHLPTQEHFLLLLFKNYFRVVDRMIE